MNLQKTGGGRCHRNHSINSILISVQPGLSAGTLERLGDPDPQLLGLVFTVRSAVEKNEAAKLAVRNGLLAVRQPLGRATGEIAQRASARVEQHVQSLFGKSDGGETLAEIARSEPVRALCHDVDSTRPPAQAA